MCLIRKLSRFSWMMNSCVSIVQFQLFKTFISILSAELDLVLMLVSAKSLDCVVWSALHCEMDATKRSWTFFSTPVIEQHINQSYLLCSWPCHFVTLIQAVKCIRRQNTLSKPLVGWWNSFGNPTLLYPMSAIQPTIRHSYQLHTAMKWERSTTVFFYLSFIIIFVTNSFIFYMVNSWVQQIEYIPRQTVWKCKPMVQQHVI